MLEIAFAMLMALVPIGAAGGEASQGVEIVTGEFGTLGRPVKQDITAKLQTLCGSSALSCSIFCSESSFGLYDVGRRPLCRVTYRCFDRSTRSVEAAREEMILLQCESKALNPVDVSGHSPVLQSPAYVSAAAGS